MPRIFLPENDFEKQKIQKRERERERDGEKGNWFGFSSCFRLGIQKEDRNGEGIYPWAIMLNFSNSF